MKSIVKLLTVICLLSACQTAESSKKVTIVPYNDLIAGAAQSDIYLPMLKGKRIAIVANHTSLVRDKHTVDILVDLGLDLQKVFCPEHGFRGNKSDGELINDQFDSKTGLPITSLYGNHKKPTVEDLKNIDMVIFDIQDVGIRFYTYLTTMTYVMQACAENNIPILIFDRPNPNGFYVDGPILESGHKSFVGIHAVPIVHGMTPGEYAMMVNGELWLENKLKCKLEVITVKNYTHFQTMDLPVKPSPNLPTFLSVLLYPSLALFEGTIVSIGRGTSFPFQVAGHPNYSKKDFSFTPMPIPEASINPPLKGQKCYGIDLRNMDIEPIILDKKINLKWIIQFYQDFGNKDEFFNTYFENLVGQDLLRRQIIEGISEDEIRKSWQNGLTHYKKIRAKYLLYPDFE
ncbi:MAG: DUF1343 domain-containing protein [Bacteroidetes bacterium HGW-Bacteroidetes-17]|nr:MAG: DUF1343 domain-containing protein [Bacteroidetes bacterium HGW-Bacteroidetes-17]